MKIILLGFILFFSLAGRAQTDTTAARDTSIIAGTSGGDTTVVTDTTIIRDTTTIAVDTVVSIDTTGMGVYGFMLTDAAGNTYLIDSFQGRKIWLVILPSTRSPDDSAFLLHIDSVAIANRSLVTTIAVPSYEDGYTGDSLHTLLNWYQMNLDSSVVISQPLYTHIASDTAQAGLFRWLTHSSSNGHYDTEVSGTGAMFFVNETGLLDGVFNSDTKWSNKVPAMMFQ